MIFNSFQFIWLFPIIFIIYYGILYVVKNIKTGSRLTKKLPNLALILISYGLYIQFKPVYALLLMGVTLVTYGFARLIENENVSKKKKYLIIFGAMMALLPLALFKYYNFINDNIGALLRDIGIAASIPGLNWMVPVGISFFSFQAVGYLFDVYYNKIEAEHDFVAYILFVCFFPQILSGPISKAASLLPQIKSERRFNYGQAVDGLKWILWGMFMKVVMADGLGIYVDTIYGSYDKYSGLTCAAASVMYSFQIYGDFAGYSYMAIGVAKTLGFNLVNNFNHPYFSVSITDFWRRWHISLSTWLKDYIYVPLGGSRCSKIHSYWNILVTFFVSGVWHGANWTFILWGMVHGIAQVVEKMLGFQKYEGKVFSTRVFRLFITFLVVNFAWILFRMPDVRSAGAVIFKIVSFDTSSFFVDSTVIFPIIATLIVWSSEAIKELFHSDFSLINNNCLVVRWTTYLSLVIMIILFGIMDSSQFIYVSF